MEAPREEPCAVHYSILAAILDTRGPVLHEDDIRRIGKLSSLGRDISEYRKRIVDFYGVPR